MALTFEILNTYQTWAANKTFTAATTDILTSVAHGLEDNDIVWVYGGTLPVPLKTEACYFVKRINADSFYLSLTPGGANIDLTTTGSGGRRFTRARDYALFTADPATNVITSAAHGLVDGERIEIGTNGTKPAGLPLFVYYVKYIDVDTFKLSITVGGDEVDITDAGTGTHHWLFTGGKNRIKLGALLTNTTRAGEAMIYVVARESFGISFATSVGIVVISGSFVALDECTTADGGSLVVYAMTATSAVNTIVVNGVDDADSTADLTGAISATVEQFYVSNFAVIPHLKYIKIDDEWMFVKYSRDEVRTNTFTVTTLNRLVRTSHGLTAGQVVRLTTTGTLPTGLATGTGYYVNVVDANNFTVSLALGGAVVAVTSGTGSGTHTFTLQDRLDVHRGVFGTTPASHADNASIFILADDLPRAIIDADVAGGWGLTSMASGKFEINANVILGRPDQPIPTLLLTTLDTCVCSGDIYIAGGVAHHTIVQSGVGWVNPATGDYQGLYLNGSNLAFTRIVQYENTTLNVFGGTLYASSDDSMFFAGACNFMTTSLSSHDYLNFVQFANQKNCKLYRTWVNNQRISAASVMLDWQDLWINYKLRQESVYFLSSGGDAFFQNMEMVDGQYDGGIFAFAAGGVKIFTDCKISTAFTQFLAGVVPIFKRSINANTATPLNVVVSGTNIRIFDQAGTTVANVTTDAFGNIEEQAVTYASYVGGVLVEANPFTFFVNKVGFKEKYFAETVDEPKLYKFILEDYQYEDELPV